ncbi:hypothetical protein SPRG_19111 [Saprolegnia parasitica CBS 223.65]|uniref:V-SNARE coiled-coil homology domain-containing protein n=1 Tax=Saprolegnia parasitica (strain CBS 223.65) TaxID=695850 RepID=A0A067CUX1_SAPPC|nr:hypothetical protein SPRG_19111 [Saprolegnia parasitica CBS 223.65]KDO34293.1 hypothetical protein SPRG_19111 [Saprolegnia parasitica CBS 223.65]|eukprot:XP_012195304.1 hypothetical protein SPRG_19111 [Saprolegnia parasitica CBS 223.65]
MGNQPGSGSPRKSKRSSLQGVLNLVQGKVDEVLEDHSRLAPDMFTVSLAGHHGLPAQPSLVCYVAAHELLVVAAGYQQIKLYGEDGLEMFVSCVANEATATAGASTSFLQPTANGRIVLVSSDSGVQVVSLEQLQSGASPIVASLPPSWTMCRITAVETIKSHKSAPFFFLALDDASIQVVQEDTCAFTTYAIQAAQLGLSGDDVAVSAMASNPSDANQLLLAYEGAHEASIFLWDLAKKKVLHKATVPPAHGSVQSLAWHASGKRFAAGFHDGAFGVFRTDKQQSAFFPTATSAPLTRLAWAATDANSPGLLMLAWTPSSPSVQLYAAPRDISAKDTLSAITKHASFPWRITSLPTSSRVMDVVMTSHMTPSASCTPFTCIALVGDPMGGVLPRIELLPVPCSVVQPLTPKEELVWIEMNVAPFPLPSSSVQTPAVAAWQIVDLGGANGSLRDDLFSTCEAKAGPSSLNGWSSPLRGGSIEHVTPQLPHDACVQLQATDLHRASLVVTAHVDASTSAVRFWELLPRHDGLGAGTLTLLHTLDLMSLELTSKQVTSSGEVAVFSFQEGFQLAFTLHVHSSAIDHMVVSASQGYLATSDSFGVVSIVHLNSQEYKLAVFDISTEEAVSVNALLLHERLLFVGRGNSCVELYDLVSADLLTRCRVSDGPLDAIAHLLLIHENGAPVHPVALESRADNETHDERKKTETAHKVAEILQSYAAPPTRRPTESHQGVRVALAPGPLGLFLDDEVQDRVLIKAFVNDAPNAARLRQHGVTAMSSLVAINGTDVSQLRKDDVVQLLASLSTESKLLTFASPRKAETPYLLCATGRSLAIFKAVAPETAPNAATSPSSTPTLAVDVEASVELRSTIASLAIVSLPIDGRLDHGILALDDCGYMYMIAAPSLRVIWSASLPSMVQTGYAFDYVHVGVAASSAEILLCTSSGDVARFSVLQSELASELSMLQWATTKVRVTSDKPAQQSTSAEPPLERRNSSSIFKVFSSSSTDVDLNKVFAVPPKDQSERERLMGDRSQAPRATGATKEVKGNMKATMGALNEATQNLHLRGEKLSDLGEKTEQLKRHADEFYQTMRAFNEREAKKKWYQI